MVYEINIESRPSTKTHPGPAYLGDLKTTMSMEISSPHVGAQTNRRTGRSDTGQVGHRRGHAS